MVEHQRQHLVHRVDLTFQILIPLPHSPTLEPKIMCYGVNFHFAPIICVGHTASVSEAMKGKVKINLMSDPVNQAMVDPLINCDVRRWP